MEAHPERDATVRGGQPPKGHDHVPGVLAEPWFDLVDEHAGAGYPPVSTALGGLADELDSDAQGCSPVG
jgi:hypothetical protein